MPHGHHEHHGQSNDVAVWPLSKQALETWPTKAGKLEKKSPSKLVMWQKRHFILSEGSMSFRHAIP